MTIAIRKSLIEPDDRRTPKSDYAAGIEQPAATAPKDADWIVAKDLDGNIVHVAWDHEEECWTRFDTEERFNMVAWVRSSWNYDQIVKWYPI